MKNDKKYLLIAWLICGLGAVYYSYEYFLRISPSVMEPALREHFNLSATGFGFFRHFIIMPMFLCRYRLVCSWIAMALDF